ncbi:MAG: hypothetical protein AAFR04_06275 [Pseudomonadota bacterium]
MNRGSAHFQQYVSNLNRIYWAEFIDQQTNVAAGPRRPSLVSSEPWPASPAPALEPSAA